MQLFTKRIYLFSIAFLPLPLFKLYSVNGTLFFRFSSYFFLIFKFFYSLTSDSEQFDDQLIGGTTNDQMSSNIFSFDNTEYTQPVPNTPLQFSSIAIKPESHTSKRKLSDSGEHQDFMVDTTSSNYPYLLIQFNFVKAIGNTLFTPNIPLVVNQNVTMPTTSAFTNSRLPQLTPIPVPMTPQTPQTPQSDVFKESSSQANQQQEPSTRLLNQIQSFYISQQEQLQQIRHLQKQVLSAPQKVNSNNDLHF